MKKSEEKKKAEDLMTNADFALDLMAGIEELAKELCDKYEKEFPESSVKKADVFNFCLIEGALANIGSEEQPLSKSL